MEKKRQVKIKVMRIIGWIFFIFGLIYLGISFFNQASFEIPLLFVYIIYMLTGFGILKLYRTDTNIITQQQTTLMKSIRITILILTILLLLPLILMIIYWGTIFIVGLWDLILGSK